MTGPGVELRPAVAGDQSAIVELCKHSLVTTYAGFMKLEKMHSWIEGSEVEDYVARMWPHMTLAIDEDRAVSGVVAIDDQVIDFVWVRDDRRGEGIGSRLMDRAERVLSARYAEAELECFTPNVASLAFYQSRGYREVRRYYERSSGVERIVLRKPLTD